MAETGTLAPRIVRCASCERPLTDPRSVARGRGPVCYRRHMRRIQTVVNNCTDTQIDKAVQLLADRLLVRRGHLFRVLDSVGRTRYECAPTGECTCKGALYGRRCYHTIAAALAA